MSDLLLPKNSIQITRGASKTLKLTVYDSDNKPLNLTGVTIVLTVKYSVEDLRNVIQKTSADPTQIRVIDPYSGEAYIRFVPADTSSRDAREYVFDVWAILASGDRYPVIPPSIFNVEAGVTVLP